MKYYEIESDDLKLSVSQVGAEIVSLQSRLWGRGIIWSGDPRYWSGHAPIAFPICGRLKNNQYVIDSQIYEMDIHGFARKKLFQKVEQKKDCLTLRLESDVETLRQYPYPFELMVTYCIEEGKLRVEYSVRNTGEQVMPFSIGGHEAYACERCVGNYGLVFEKEETFQSLRIKGGLLSHDSEMLFPPGKEIDLNNYDFNKGAMVFQNLKSNWVKLLPKTGRRALRLELGGCAYFLIWSIPGAPFLCLEPWYGIHDREDANGFFLEKQGLRFLLPGASFSCRHCLAVEDGAFQ